MGSQKLPRDLEQTRDLATPLVLLSIRQCPLWEAAFCGRMIDIAT